MNVIYSPLRYPGGKNCIFPFISNIFQVNDLIGYSYAEPYAGGAGLALRLLFEEYVNHIFINDLDPLIYAFWKAAMERTDDFCSWIEKTMITVKTWKKCKEIIRNPEKHDFFELGTSTFFLNRTNVSGIIDGGIIGGLEQRGPYKIDARYNRSKLIEKIEKIGRFSDRISLSNLDGIAFIRYLNHRKQDIFIYLDPPYYEKSSRLYMNVYKKEDHINLSNFIPNLNKHWIVSYDNNQFIINLYSNYRKISYHISHATSNKIGNEIFVFSDHLKLDLSSESLKGAMAIG